MRRPRLAFFVAVVVAAPNGQSLESSYRTNAASGSPSITMSQNANWRTIGIEIAHA